MSTTLEDLNNTQAAYDAAFAEDFPAPVELSEDEAFGIMPEVPAEDGASDGNSEHTGGDASAAVTLAEVPETPEEEEAQAIAGTPEPGEQAEEDVVAPPSPEDIQREKSWEGRLRAREAQLAAREAELAAIEAKLKGGQPARADGGEVEEDDFETPAHENAESPEVEAMEDATEQLESGKPLSAVMQSLRDDFGDDFVVAIESMVKAQAAEIAEKMVGDKVGNVSTTVQQLLADIEDRDQRAHFKAVANAHPDFMEVSQGEAMQSFLSGLPDDQRKAAEAVIEEGDASDVIALLDAVKEASKPQEQHADDDTMDAAEGVRSTGMKLPEKPAQADDYSAAWNDF